MWGKLLVDRGLRRWRVVGYSSPLFTSLHISLPSMKTGSSLLWCPALVFYDDRLGASMVTSFCLLRWLGLWFVWRVVKSGEECTATLHLSAPQCLSGFQAVWWRVKSKSESSLFLSSSLFFFFLVASSPSSCCFSFFLPTCRFLPGNGKKLPWLGAI